MNDERARALAKWRAWAATPIGKAFVAFERASERYWQADGADRASDQRLTELFDALMKARSELLALLGEGIGDA